MLPSPATRIGSQIMTRRSRATCLRCCLLSACFICVHFLPVQCLPHFSPCVRLRRRPLHPCVVCSIVSPQMPKVVFIYKQLLPNVPGVARLAAMDVASVDARAAEKENTTARRFSNQMQADTNPTPPTRAPPPPPDKLRAACNTVKISSAYEHASVSMLATLRC